MPLCVLPRTDRPTGWSSGQLTRPPHHMPDGSAASPSPSTASRQHLAGLSRDISFTPIAQANRLRPREGSAVEGPDGVPPGVRQVVQGIITGTRRSRAVATPGSCPEPPQPPVSAGRRAPMYRPATVAQRRTARSGTAVRRQELRSRIAALPGIDTAHANPGAVPASRQSADPCTSRPTVGHGHRRRGSPEPSLRWGGGPRVGAVPGVPDRTTTSTLTGSRDPGAERTAQRAEPTDLTRR